MKNAIQFGAGNIGRGFIGVVLRKSSYNVLFCDVNREIIDKINEKLDYLINEVEDAKIRPIIETCTHKKDANLIGALANFLEEYVR